MGGIKGFTIVELLIVVVVIAILAAITLTAYTGVREQAQTANTSSVLQQSSKALSLYKIKNSETYPASLTDAGVNLDSSYSPYYQRSTDGSRFCLAVSASGQGQFITSEVTKPSAGSCEALILWNPLNSSIEDASISAHTMQNTGAVATTGQNSSSGAYSFNGTSDGLTAVYKNSILNVGQPGLTATAWFNSTTGLGTHAIINRNAPIIIWQAATSLNIGLNQGSWYWTNPAQTFGSGWHFVALVYNGTSRDVYLDMVKIVSGDTQITGNIQTNATNLNVGFDACCGGRYYFQGSIDDVRLYGRVLDATELQAMYLAGAV